jgi:hypothetical protein
VPKVLELTRKALGEDKCVVIGLQSTGESAQTSVFDEDEDPDLAGWLQVSAVITRPVGRER